MSHTNQRIPFAALAAAVLAVCVLTAQSPGDPLRRGFENPPDSAKPRVWWHWMNGNITKEGIQADLEQHQVAPDKKQNGLLHRWNRPLGYFRKKLKTRWSTSSLPLPSEEEHPGRPLRGG
jgi:alpha-L-rhamnosidase